MKILSLRHYFIFLNLLLCSSYLSGQLVDYDLKRNDLPDFIKLMYSPNPNINEVAALFKQYKLNVIEPAKANYFANPLNKNTKFKDPFEHAYKIWLSQNLNALTPDGTVDYSPRAIAQRQSVIDKIHKQNELTSRNADPWVNLGPNSITSADNGTKISSQANVFDIGSTPLYPEYIYAGTEAGGLFKSSDYGKSWKKLANDLNLRWVQAVGVTVLSPEYVRIGIPGKILFSDNGGSTWTECPINSTMSNNFQTYQILHCSDPNNYHIAYAATSDGILISYDYGKSWTKILSGRCTSIEEHPTKPATVYALLYDSNKKMTQFILTNDYGKNWGLYPENNGWFQIPANDQGKFNVWGGRIAVTPASPDKVYVILNEAYSDTSASLKTYGFIGLYISDNNGATWTRKNRKIGAPYNNMDHKNLMSWGTFEGPGKPYSYNQVDYLNNAIAVSSLDPNIIYIGALSMWESKNGGSSWSTVGGYSSTYPNIHPDIRRIKFRKKSSNTEELFWCSDGGVNFSPDGLLDSHEARNNGLYATEFWGFDIDNKTLLFGGGCFHNGNNYFQLGFPEKEYKHAGGGEEPTGFVQYGDKPSISFFNTFGANATIGLLNSISDKIVNTKNILQDSKWSPNVSLDYFPYRGSNYIIDSKSANVSYWGTQSRFCKSDDNGKSATVLYDFGDSTRVEWFEQDVVTNSILYLKTENLKVKLKNTWNFYVSTNGGYSWTLLKEKTADFVFALADYKVFRTNNQKIEVSYDLGMSWTSLHSSDIDGQNIISICYVPGHQHGLFIATEFGGVYNYMDDPRFNKWENISNGLNPAANVTRLLYNSNYAILMLATRGLGIYGIQLNNTSLSSIDAMFSNNFTPNYCTGEEVSFFNRSTNTVDADFNWTFTKGNPASSTLENPKVRYTEAGTWPVALTVKDKYFNQTASTSSSAQHGNKYITVVRKSALPFKEDFEKGNISSDWIKTDLNGNNRSWKVTDRASAFGQGKYSLCFNNYDESDPGIKEEIRIIKADLSNAKSAELSFDLAYAKYASEPNQNDSLAILVSTDCGETQSIVYINGGNNMATAVAPNKSFIPSASEWRNIKINLAPYIGNVEVQLIIQNRGAAGNYVYIDNFGLSGQFVGTKEDIISHSLQVSPNPNNGIFNIKFEFPETFKNGTLCLVDPYGKTIYKTNIHHDQHEFNQDIKVDQLSPGLYQLRLSDQTLNLSHKILIIK